MSEERRTMNKVEMFDLVDKEDNVIGQASRDEAHSNPEIIHRVVHLLVLNKQGQLLVHQRSFQKEYGAGEWQLMSGGHVSSGENRVEAAVRELKEETGFEGQILEIAQHLFNFEKENELASLHVCLVDGEPVPNEEVEEFNFINFNEISELPGFEDFSYPEYANNWYGVWMKTIVENQSKIEEFIKARLTFTTTPSGE